MARRSKEDALATRHRLLDAAECMFQAKGVSATSMGDIAVHAGTTRGAVYWHFKDKADIFNAMMERVSLPLELAIDNARRGDNPLASLRAAIMGALERMVTDPQTRRVFEVATQKVEYVDDLFAVRQRHLKVRDKFYIGIRGALLAAARNRGLRLRIPAQAAAEGLFALLDGLIRNWLLDSERPELLRTGLKVMDVYLVGLGFAPE